MRVNCLSKNGHGDKDTAVFNAEETKHVERAKLLFYIWGMHSWIESFNKIGCQLVKGSLDIGIRWSEEYDGDGNDQRVWEFLTTPEASKNFDGQEIYLPSPPPSSVATKKKLPVLWVKNNNPFKLWLKDSTRSKYWRVTFQPEPPLDKRESTPDKRLLNTWEGWPMLKKMRNWKETPESKEALEFILNHIKDVIVGKSEDHYDYIMKCLAHIFQRPNIKLNVAIVLQGMKGAGKSTFIKLIQSISGKYTTEVSHLHHFVGNFNIHLRQKVIVVLSEITWGGNHQLEGVLKSSITSDKSLWDEKGVTPFEGKNYWNVFIDTNPGWSVPATLDNRRFFIPTISGEKVRNFGYFKKLVNATNVGKEAFLHHLLYHIKLPQNWNAAEELPQTVHVIEQALKNRDISDLNWLLNLLKSDSEWIGYGSEEDKKMDHRTVPILTNKGSEFVTRQTLLKCWMLEKIPYSKVTDETYLESFFDEYLKDCFEKKKRGPTSLGRRPWGWRIYSIQKIKEHLEKEVLRQPGYFCNEDDNDNDNDNGDDEIEVR